MDVPGGTIVVFADIACPWTHLCVHRLFGARARLGLDETIRFDFRAFPLELFNDRGVPKAIMDAEIPVVGGLDPGAGWRMWTGPEHDYPVSTLTALEAVEAAKAHGLEPSARLARALRRAFFAQARNVSLLHVVLDVARGVEGLDADALAAALRSGTSRGRIFADKDEAQRIGVKGSPHLYLPDGTDVHNPGIRKHWEGDVDAGGIPVVDSDDPSVFDALLERAAGR